MKNISRNVAKAIGLLFGVAAALGSYRLLTPPESAEPMPSTLAVAATATMPLSGSGTLASPFGSGAPAIQDAKEAPASISAGLLRVFNSSGSSKERIEFAKQHLKEGGSIYAAAMLAQCQGVSGIPSVEEGPGAIARSDPQYHRRVVAAELLRRRCGDMKPSELTDETRSQLTQLGRQAGDPLLAVAERRRRASFSDDAESLAARRISVAQLLATRDPLLVDDAGMGLLLYADASTGKKYFWFDGQSYAHDSDDEVGAALYLLPCGLGLRCDHTDHKIALSCASGDVCDTDRFEQLRRMFASRPGVYEKVERLYDRMLSALQSGNTAAFTR